MRKIIIAVAAVLVVGVGAGSFWWVYAHLLRSPVVAARELLARGDVRAAQLELRNAVRRDPANAEAHFELGQLQLQFGDAVAAEKELQAARAAGERDPRVTALLARSYLAQDKFRDLLKAFSPAGLPPAEAASVLVSRSLAQIALHDAPSARASAITAERLAPTLAEAPMAIARIAAATGDRGQALLKVEQALKLDPRLLEALGLKADLLRGQGDLVQAMATLDAAVQVAPYLPRVRLARARALLIAGEDTRAKQDVEAALKLDAKNTLGLYLQSLLLIRARDWPAANVSLQKIQPVLSQVPRGEYYYALAKSNVGQTEQAAEAVGHYLGHTKSDADGWRLLARIRLQMGRPAEAAEALKQAEALGGDRAAPAGGEIAAGSGGGAKSDEPPASSPEALTQLASRQLGSGDADAAGHDLDQSLETPPTRADTGAVQVLSALATGDIERAQAALERLQRQPRAQPEVVANLAGLLRMAQLDFAGASAAWAEAVKAAPEAVPPRVNLARVLALRGQTAEAERVLGEILDTQPANRSALRTLVEILVSENKLDRAVAVVRVARKAQPGTLGLLVTEAALQARRGDFAAAYGALDEVALEQALSPLLLTTRAQIQLAQDHKREAADSYRQILLNAPDDLVTRRRLIDLMVALDNGDEAQRLTEYGLALAPGNSALLQVAAMLTWRLKGLDAALDSVDRMLQDPINLPTARLLKGGLYMAAKRYADAAAAYGAEMREMPFTTLAISQAGALRAAGRADEATALLRDWVARQPDPAVAESLASLDIEAHRLDEAERNLGSVLATRPNDAIALNNLAWIYAQRNDQRARALAQKAYLLAPGAQTADTLGWIVAQQGEAELGTMLLRRAAQQLTGDATVQYHLAFALKASGQRAEATALATALLARAGAFDERAQTQRLLAELTDQTAK